MTRRPFFRYLPLTFVAVALLSSFVHGSNNDLIGSWIYYKKIYMGVEIPDVPDSDLVLRFDFSNNGSSRLYWYQLDEVNFCDRKGEFETRNGFLFDHIIWVNPRNSISCSGDPDMQMGRTTRTPYYIDNDEFHLVLSLGEEELIYVWKRTDMPTPPYLDTSKVSKSPRKGSTQ